MVQKTHDQKEEEFHTIQTKCSTIASFYCSSVNKMLYNWRQSRMGSDVIYHVSGPLMLGDGMPLPSSICILRFNFACVNMILIRKRFVFALSGIQNLLRPIRDVAQDQWMEFYKLYEALARLFRVELSG